MPDNTFSASTLATLDDVKRELKERGVWKPEDDMAENDVIDALRIMTATFEGRTKKWFQSRVATRYYDARGLGEGGDLDGYDLILDHALYELTALLNGDGSTITSDQYLLIPKSGPPYTRIRLIPSVMYWRADVTGVPQDSIRVDGVWVDGRAYSGQWLPAVDVVEGMTLAGVETVLVDWAADTNPFGQSPRFSPGQLVRVTQSGASEYGAVLKTDLENKTLRIRRGERGTTSILWGDQAPIDVWWVDPRVAFAVAYGAAYLYKQRGRFQSSEFDAATGVQTRFKGGLPQIVEDIIAEYTDQSPAKPMIFAV